MKTRNLVTLLVALCITIAPTAAFAQISADKTLADVESAQFSAPIAGTALNATITTSSNFPPEIGRAIAAAFPPNMIFKSSDLPRGTDLNAIYQGCATMVSDGEDGDGGLAAVAYTSGSGGEIAMLSVDDGRTEILDAVDDSKYSFAGGYCRAYDYNLTNPSDPDDSPLAHAFEISFNGEDWFFGWDGQKLVNLTPTNDFQKMSPPITDIYGADVVDIDRTGPLQIMGNNGDWDSIRRSDGIMSSGTYTLFRYNGKKFVPSSKYRAFIDDSGLSGYQMHGYGMHHTPAPSYIMTVLNGARDGRRRVKGATITLDGVKIFGPGQINKSEGMVSQVVNLKHMGEIDVNIQGGSHAVFYILIQKTP
jgi:hypothetical protein